MRNLNFKYFKAKNFLCFGPEGIEIDFSHFDNITIIKGENLDDSNEEAGQIASNGSGKSSLFEPIVYGLYGKTIKKAKKISHDNVINNQVKKGLYVEVRWDNYRVVRTREKDSLRFWIAPDEDFDWDDWINNRSNELKDKYEETQATTAQTQKRIEKELGLTYETFMNLVIFEDRSDLSFLESNLPTKREIVENLLGLEKYRDFFDKAKEAKKALKNEIDFLSREYNTAIAEQESSKERIHQLEEDEKRWKQNKENEIKKLESKIVEIKSKAANTDFGYLFSRFEEAQNLLRDLNNKLPGMQEQVILLQKSIDESRDKIQRIKQKKYTINIDLTTLNNNVKSTKEKIASEEKKIKKLENLEEGVKCSECYGTIHVSNSKNVIQQAKNVIQSEESKLKKMAVEGSKMLNMTNQCDEVINKIQNEIDDNEMSQVAINREIKKARDAIQEISLLEKPEPSAADLAMKNEIEVLEKHILSKKEELFATSPYEEPRIRLVKEAEERVLTCKNKKESLDKKSNMLPYYDFWVKAFGDDGIRKFVIDGIIPALNSRLAYWMQYLVDSKFSIEFNNKLEEKIERCPPNGNPFVYHTMSGGEKRRLNLAVSQTFAHISMLNSGANPSFEFLDEVELNVDQLGIEGIYNMLIELAREKKIFVATHNSKLLSLLDGCKVITLRKKNGFTNLVE